MRYRINLGIALAGLLMGFGGNAYAQQVSGKVVDSQNLPIEAATVVMQTPDSVFVDAAMTDSTGVYRIDGHNNQSDKKQAIPERYRLIVQHLMYETKQVTASGADAGVVVLEGQNYELGEVTVKADRPIVKVEDGHLSYDVPQLTKDKSVTNAFEALQELPGVILSDGVLTLAGAGTPGILLNGQLTTMTYEQLINLLKSTPASRVKKAEVMYSAPPQYNIRGALINVILEESVAKGNVLQGEVAADYVQRTYSSAGFRGNVVYSTPTFSLDVLYSNRLGKTKNAEDMFARHILQGVAHEVDQENSSADKGTTHTARVATGFTMKNKDKLNVVYTGTFSDSDSKRQSDTRIDNQTPVHTDNAFGGPSALHNGKVEYNGRQGLVVGADYTYYDDTSAQKLANTVQAGAGNRIHSDSEQKIHRGMLFANHTLTLPKEWKLNYGTNLTFVRNKSYSNTYLDDVFDPASSFSSTQEEITGNFFAGFTKSFSQKFTVQASLAAEYYKCTQKSGGAKLDLWDDVAFFPNVNATYVFTPKHILQFSLSSNKRYPGYWAINPAVYYLNAYSEVQGNPELKPTRSYSSQLTYIFRQKYVLTAYFNRANDYFTQLPYQSPTELKTVFQTLNFDYQQQIGMALVIPFQIKEVLNSRLTLNALQQREKASHFHDVPFDRKKFFGVFQLNNTINLSKKPDLKMDLNGQYITPAQQGIYDLTRFYGVSGGIKWTFAKEKAQLTLRCDDIFNTNLPETEIDYKGQYSRMTVFKDTRTLTLSFVYKFGGFKKGKEVTVDTSRFGQ